MLTPNSTDYLPSNAKKHEILRYMYVSSYTQGVIDQSFKCKNVYMKILSIVVTTAATVRRHSSMPLQFRKKNFASGGPGQLP
jgi:hypothetical protein